MLRLLYLFSFSIAVLPTRVFLREDLRCMIGASPSVDGAGSPSAVEALFKLIESFGRLALRVEKNGWSNSIFGDS